MMSSQIDRADRHVWAVFACILAAASIVGCGGEKEPATGTLIVNSTPDGVSIMVDGIDYGHTPARITDIALGEHYVILMSPDHERLNHRVSIDSEEPLELNLIMEHHSGRLRVSTEPIGADVLIIDEDDTKNIGITPLPPTPIKTGSYTLEIRKENFYPIQEELTVERGGLYTYDRGLTAMEAQLRVFSRPSDADIYINDELRGERTPAMITMTPGEYTIGVHKEGYIINETTLELKPNVTESVSAELKEGYMPIGMVLIPAGTFQFGEDNKSPDEKPRSVVELPAFYIDKYEVTNAQFKKIFPAHTFDDGREDYPVRGISWKQAADYAQAVGKRLPTEREWEKAARGPNGNEYPWGNAFDPSLVNYSSGVVSASKRIGSHRKGASYYGCFDMAGNVYEWVNDWYDPYPNNPDVEIEYGTVYKVLRGGSYNSDSFEVRSAKRHYAKPETKREDYGFRCAMDVE